MWTEWGHFLLVPAFAGNLSEVRVMELAKHCGSLCVCSGGIVFASGLLNYTRAGQWAQ